MAYEPKNGDAAIFPNDKRGNEKAPDMRGYVLAHRDLKAGEKVELAMWKRDGSNGGFYSGKISDPRKKAESADARDSDAIPF